MGQQTIANPGNVWGEVANPLTSGNAMNHGAQIVTVRANDTIAAKNAVGWVAPTATVPLSVELLDVSDATAAAVFAGVALDSGVAGEMIRVVVEGPCIVTVDDGTPVFGVYAIKHATVDGCVIATATVDASTLAGTIVGVFLSAEIGTTNTAWFLAGVKV